MLKMNDHQLRTIRGITTKCQLLAEMYRDIPMTWRVERYSSQVKETDTISLVGSNVNDDLRRSDSARFVHVFVGPRGGALWSRQSDRLYVPHGCARL